MTSDLADEPLTSSHLLYGRRITTLPSVNDRLAWNEGRGGQSFAPSMNEFGDWLCRCASAYQNAHSIAVEQAGGSRAPVKQTGPTNGKLKARNHHTSTTDQQNKSTEKSTTRDPVCFLYKSNHRLESCPKFIELPVGEHLPDVTHLVLLKKIFKLKGAHAHF